jgi:hypothetical protein
MTTNSTPEPDETYERIMAEMTVPCSGCGQPRAVYRTGMGDARCGSCGRRFNREPDETYEQNDPVMGRGRGVPIRGMNPKPMPSRLTWLDLVAVGLCLAGVALGAWWLW